MDKFKKDSPNLKAEPKGLIFIEVEKQAKVVYFGGDANNSYLATAYIPEQKAIVLIYLSTKTEEEFSKNIEAFHALVKSYSFLTDKATEQ